MVFSVFSAYTNAFYQVPAFILPNHTLEEITTLTKPLFDAFDALGLVYAKTLDVYPTYADTVAALPSFAAPTVNDNQWGGRILPRSAWTDEAAFQRYLAAAKEIVNNGYVVTDVEIHPTQKLSGTTDNAVFPQWRTAQRLYLTFKSVFLSRQMKLVY